MKNLMTFEIAKKLFRENMSFRMDGKKAEWNIIKLTDKQITICMNSENNLGSKFNGRSYTFRFNNIGYIRQGQYLTVDNI